MLRTTSKVLAKPRGHIMHRLYSPNIFGLPMAKVTWQAPHNGMYPFQANGNLWDRLFSSPLGGGHRSNRMTFYMIRNYLFMGPAAAMAVIWLNHSDTYTLFAMLHWFPWFFMDITIPLPEWVQEMQAEKLKKQPRELYGVTHKYIIGGTVSIPGSDINITC